MPEHIVGAHTTSRGSDRTNTPWGSIALPYYKGDFLLYPKERMESKGRPTQIGPGGAEEKEGETEDD